MTFLTRDLEDMRAGWRKVADNMHMTIFVFRQQHETSEPTFRAVTNLNQGVGELFETIEPAGPAPQVVSAAGRFEIARCEPTAPA
jgi:hypothetical protein